MRLILIFAMLFLVSCSYKPIWIKENLNPENFNPESIDYRACQLGSAPVVFKKEDRTFFYGEPNEYRDTCGRVQILHMQEQLVVSCAIYDEWALRINEFKNEAYVSLIDFKKTGDTLFSSDVKFSNHTKLSDLKSTFPNSFKFLNIGLSYSANDTYPYWMVLDVIDERPRVALTETITLFFNADKRLELLEYRWWPQHSEEQWVRYLEQEKERKKASHF
jgi:hypothetical protein